MRRKPAASATASPWRSKLPRVSFCIPVYNGGRYIRQAIESVLVQEPADWELLIFDNASTDDTADVCRSFNDPRLKHLHFADHTGQAGNFNRCLQQAQGDFITMLHADDRLLPGFLQPRLEAFERMPELAYVFGPVQMIDATGRPTVVRSRWEGERCLAAIEVVEALLFGAVVCGPTVLFRAEAGRGAGLYRTDFTWGHDWEWNIRLAEQGPAYHLSGAHAEYREHEQSGTAAELNAGRNGSQERMILKELFARFKEPRLQGHRKAAFDSLALRHLNFAGRALDRGLKPVARRNVSDAFAAAPRFLAKPTFWALLAGAFVSPSLYTFYRGLRGSTSPLSLG